MKKIQIILLSLATLCVLVSPVAALAVYNPINNVSGGQVTDLGGLINAILQKLWVVFAGIAVICFLIAGILFLTANGQADKIAAARSSFIWGVAGVVVGIIAYSIIAIVGSFVS